MRGEGSPFAHFQVKSPDRNEVGRWAEIQVRINTPCYPRYLNFIQPPVVTRVSRYLEADACIT
jgi:hypothetical protein